VGVKVTRVITSDGKNLEVALKNLSGKVAKVGWLEKAKYPEPPNTPVAYVATIQEYGFPAKNIPPRPFMRPTITQKQVEWKEVARRGANAVLKGNSTIEQVMESIGAKAAGDIRKTISNIWSPPLSPRTIARRLAKRANKKKKGRLDKPLIDTGILFATLTSTIEDE
jgi:hypothetical protein